MLLCQILHTREQLCVTLCVDPAEHERWGGWVQRGGALPLSLLHVMALVCHSVVHQSGRLKEEWMLSERRCILLNRKPMASVPSLMALRGQQRSQLPKLNRYIYAGYILKKDSVQYFNNWRSNIFCRLSAISGTLR